MKLPCLRDFWTILADSNMPMTFCTEAVNINKTFNINIKKSLNDRTLKKMWAEKIRTTCYLKAVGCKAYTWIPGSQRKKLDQRSKPEIFVVHCTNKGRYRI